MQSSKCGIDWNVIHFWIQYKAFYIKKMYTYKDNKPLIYRHGVQYRTLRVKKSDHTFYCYLQIIETSVTSKDRELRKLKHSGKFCQLIMTNFPYLFNTMEIKGLFLRIEVKKVKKNINY